MVTVLMMAGFGKYGYDGLENIKLTIESFRLFADIELSFVIVDNHSTDGLREWAQEQADLTYVLPDGEGIGCGKAINMVRKELGIDTDLLTMEGHYLLTPGCLSRLKELLYAKENIGAVWGVVCNAEDSGRDVCTDYHMAVEMANGEKETRGEYALLPYNGMVLWKKEVIDALGEFEEETDSLYTTADDYGIRVIMSGRKMMVCSNAFVWGTGDLRMQYARLLGGDKVLEKKWGMHYFNRSGNPCLIQQMEAGPEEDFSVLEIGCDCGATLLEIKNRYPGAKVYGCEINEAAAAIASHVAEVSASNIEDGNLPFPKRTFRYIIFGDVLEHLRNPFEVLVYCRELLCEGGSVIASIPNLMHISVMEQLLQGNFTYTETGLLDKTHIHFFTYYEIVRMFAKAGYRISALNSISMPVGQKQQQLIDSLLALEGNAAERWMYEAFQYNIRAEISSTD